MFFKKIYVDIFHVVKRFLPLAGHLVVLLLDAETWTKIQCLICREEEEDDEKRNEIHENAVVVES